MASIIQLIQKTQSLISQGHYKSKQWQSPEFCLDALETSEKG